MKNQIKIGSILSYIVIILNILVGLIYTPIMLRIMGQSEYGTYSLISSIIGYLTVLDLGFGNAIIVYTSRYRAKNKQDEQAKLNGMFLIIYSIIGIVAGIMGAILYSNIDKIFGSTMSIEEIQKAKSMTIILIINLVFTFPLSIFGSIITAYEKFIFSKLVNILRIILMPCIMIPLLYMGYRSVAMTIVTTILNLSCLLINLIYCLKVIKIKFNFGKFDTKLLKQIFGYSFFIFLAIIVDKINLNIDQFILGSVVGTIEVALYTVAAQIHTLYVSLSTAINGVLLPKITMLIENKESDEKISDIFIQAGRLQYIVMALITTGFVIFGQEFIRIWAGEGYQKSYWTELILMVPAIVPLIQNTGIHILQAKNMHKFRTVVYFFIAIANLFISIPLAKKFGSIGSAVGTSIACLIGQWLIMNIYYYKKANIDIPRFWKNILKMSIPMLIIFIPTYIFNCMAFSTNIIIIGIKIIIYSILYCILLWFFALNDYEKNLIKKPATQILRKFKINYHKEK